jgi:hypothetical protein
MHIHATAKKDALFVDSKEIEHECKETSSPEMARLSVELVLMGERGKTVRPFLTFDRNVPVTTRRMSQWPPHEKTRVPRRVSPPAMTSVVSRAHLCRRPAGGYLLRRRRPPAFLSFLNLERFPRPGVALAMFILPRT